MLILNQRVRTVRLIGLVVLVVLAYRYLGLGLALQLTDSDEFSTTKSNLNNQNRNGFFNSLGSKALNKCPNYVEYSQKKHPPYSMGPYKYPYMRPVTQCRTFVSEAVEYIIKDLQDKVIDTDLARLIENCLPNTLDTTILWHSTGGVKLRFGTLPQTFVVTGDIHAEWLRDSARQLSVYQPFIKYDNKLKEMIRGAINTQVGYILNSGYCNAFHPPPGTGIEKGETAMDNVFPQPDWRQVFECKYELDSLASFLTLSREYYENSGGDTSFITKQWITAFERILIILKRESLPTFDKETGRVLAYYYSFQRNTNIGTETLPLNGLGNPVNYGTGLVRSAFRPSDDACTFQFFIPANMHMVSELKKARSTYLKPDIISSATAIKSGNEIRNLEIILETTDDFIENIEKGIKDFGILDHPTYGKVYAYEVDGYGSSVFMDDANIPSLLSAPDMGFLSKDDEVYQNTRKMVLSKNGNPYYLQGKYFKGIGGPHIGIQNAWPMSLLMAIRTTDDDEEIKQNLKMIMDTTAGLGLMHESIHVNSREGHSFTRSWFAWCNSEFGKTILHLAKHKPHLIFKKEYSETSYDLDAVLSEMNA